MVVVGEVLVVDAAGVVESVYSVVGALEVVELVCSVVNAGVVKRVFCCGSRRTCQTCPFCS